MRLSATILGIAIALGGCNAGGAAPYRPATAFAAGAAPAASGAISARFVEGAPVLATSINGIVQDLGTASLSVNGQTVASIFPYGYLTQYLTLRAGTVSVKAFDSVGYSVGPMTLSGLVAGKSYSIVLVGDYPHYRLIGFADPAPTKGASLAVYQASPKRASIDYGRFVSSVTACSSASRFARLGSVRLGAVARASLGAKVKAFGGYVGRGTAPLAGGSVTPCDANSFDTANALPFENSGRLSIFLLDPGPAGATGPAIGVLDQ